MAEILDAAAAPAGAPADSTPPAAALRRGGDDEPQLPRSRHRHHRDPRPAGGEEDFELSSEDERAAGTAGILDTATGEVTPTPTARALRARRGPAAAGRAPAAAPAGQEQEREPRRRRGPPAAFLPTFGDDLTALLDVSAWGRPGQGLLTVRAAAAFALAALLSFTFAPALLWGAPWWPLAGAAAAPVPPLPWRAEARLLLTAGFENAALFSLMAAGALQAAAVAPLMMPAMRSADGAPLWPFLAAGPLLGAISFLSYLCVYEGPPHPPPRLPPPSAELRRGGVAGRALRVLEGRALPALLLAGAALLGATAAGANAATWGAFWRLLASSRAARAAAAEAAITALLACALARRDARLRGLRGRALAGATALAALPLVGPCLYLLLLRPTAALGRRRGERRGARAPAAAAEEEEAQLPPPPAASEGLGPAAALRTLGALLVALPHAAAAFALSVLVVLMPSRGALRRRLAGARRRVRRVASFVFQGASIERARVPVRQVRAAWLKERGRGKKKVLRQ